MTTEAEGDLLYNVTEEYWREFSRLVAATLKKVPKHLHAEALVRLEDKSSVHGSDYRRYMRG